jgi:8-oxo-dGTP diphosphatase
MGTADTDRKINAAFAACRAALAAIAGLRDRRDRADAAAQLSDRLQDFSAEAVRMRNEDALQLFESEKLSLGQLARLAGVSKARADQLVRRHRAQRKHQPHPVEEPVPETTAHTPQPLLDAHTPLRPSIVAAIVTSKEGVLIERRHDGRPLWTFPAGEAEPGESPADTAIRETKEECGIQIVVSHVIGERNHPKTGRHMIYLAARPYQGTAVHNGDEAELAEVKWVHMGEAEELLVGMFEPVHEHLAQVLTSHVP